MATLHFRNAKIYLGSTSAAAPVAITEARSFDLSFDGAALEEDNALGDTYTTQLAGLLSWSASFESNFDTAQTVIQDAASQILGPVRFYGYPDVSVTGRYYTGLCWVKYSLSGGVSAVGRVSVDLTGDGALTVA